LGSLFLYAHIVIRYIGDCAIGDLTGQLKDILLVINAHLLPDVQHEKHPMVLLDALYSWILSQVTDSVRRNMQKLLLALIASWEPLLSDEGRNFLVLCNWLGMTCDEAYAALHPLSSVLIVPGCDKAHEGELQYFQKSFIDYISDFA
jgi:hypothetical protein